MDLNQFTSSGQLPKAELTRQQRYFADRPPRFLSESYAPRPTEVRDLTFDGHGELINPCFDLGCKRCGKADHRLTLGRGSFWSRRGKGLSTDCLNCGHHAVLMGKDGAGPAWLCDCGSEAVRPGSRFEYPGDLFEFPGAEGHEPEGFSWVTAFATCTDCGARSILADAETS